MNEASATTLPPDVAAELEAAHQAVAEHRSLERRLVVLTEEVARAERAATQAHAVLRDEEADVARLESWSPTRILAGLRGDRDADLTREQAEADLARMRAAGADAALGRARQQEHEVRTRLVRCGDADGRLSAALWAKEQWLVQSGDPRGERLAAILAEHGTGLDRLREIAEAQAAATAAHAALRDVASLLGDAHGLATYDTFFSGGLFADVMKYGRLDRAQAGLRAADGALAHLAAELADVGLEGPGSIQIDQLTQFFDVFFDNIFSDWAVRGRVRDALDKVQQTLARLDDVSMLLARHAAEMEECLGDLRAERERLLS